MKNKNVFITIWRKWKKLYFFSRSAFLRKMIHNIQEKKGDNKKQKNTLYLKKRVIKSVHDLFSNVFSSITLTNRQIIPANMLKVKAIKWIGNSGVLKAEMIKTDPNQPAERLIDRPARVFIHALLPILYIKIIISYNLSLMKKI